MDIIKVEKLTKIYKTYERGDTFKDVFVSLFHRKHIIKKAVDDVSFSIPEGKIVGLIGPNGAGKSTIIKMMTGVLYPTSGEIDVMGYIPWKQRTKYVFNIGAVFGQKSQLIWDIPPLDAFNMNKAIYDIPHDKYTYTLDKLVSSLEIQDEIKKPTRVLSLGERMKCEFVMAMLHSPKIVFLDEPTIGLDIIAKETIREFIKKQNAHGTTFILTTHDIGDIEQLAKDVIMINDGAIVFNGSLDEIKKHMGDKKIVNITMKSKLPDININGVDVINKISKYENRLEVDCNIIEINSFIEKISTLGEIADISIKELPIENIIKNMYNK